MKGDDVVEFQTLITRLGIDCGKIDGKCGKKINTKGGVGYGARYIVHINTRGNRARWKY